MLAWGELLPGTSRALELRSFGASEIQVLAAEIRPLGDLSADVRSQLETDFRRIIVCLDGE